MAAMYVVFAISEEAEPDFKVFVHRPDASAYATAAARNGADTADVYQIDGVSDARAAKAALQMGEGHFIEGYGRRATKAEIEKWELQRWVVDIC